jgi:hypothetical protein
MAMIKAKRDEADIGQRLVYSLQQPSLLVYWNLLPHHVSHPLMV